MNIKCPNCRTAYVVPDSKIGDKPKKMRCSRCKEIFTVKRRSDKTPIGYQEFTGQQEALPKEFAFLRVSRNAPPPFATPSEPSSKDDPSPPPQDDASPPSPPKDIFEKAEKEAAARSRFEDFAPGYDNEKTQPGFGLGLRIQASHAGDDGRDTAPPADDGRDTEPSANDGTAAVAPVAQAVPISPASPPETSPVQAQPMAAAVAAAAQPVAQPAAPQPAPAPQPIFPPADQPVHEIYGSASWETEAPLELGDYAAPSEKSQRIGKIVAISIGVVVLLFVFVTYRNGWSLSLSELPQEFAFAFSGGERENLPDEVADLEATVSERRVVTTRTSTYLVVTGTVFNNSQVKRSKIMLRGRLIDVTGDVRKTTEAPCEITLDDLLLKQISPGQVRSHYREKGKPFNCILKGEASTSFQLIFASPPADYNKSFDIEVLPIFAE
jgi:predicted Zn finger-like uncharacterized protein